MSGGRPAQSPAQSVAHAVTRRVEKHVKWADRPIELARVRDVTNPMKIELFRGPHVIEEDQDFKMSQFLRWWDLNYQLQKGDVLLLVRVEDDAWIAFDVRTDRDVDAGIRPSRPPATPTGDMRPAETSGDITYLAPSGGGTVTQNHHIIKKLEVYDKNGTRIGYVPVYQDLP